MFYAQKSTLSKESLFKKKFRDASRDRGSRSQISNNTPSPPRCNVSKGQWLKSGDLDSAFIYAERAQVKLLDGNANELICFMDRRPCVRWRRTTEG
eukprot:763570-Hanusia_phi.AAC.3